MAKRKYPKKPRKPKRSASLKTWEAYQKRYNEWKKKCSTIDSNLKKKEKLIAKLS